MPRPTGLPRSVADGPSADRILLIGSGPAVGWGVASHDLALPGALARALRAATGRGAIVDVICDRDMTSSDLPAVLGGARLDYYDAVVTTVGINDAVRFTTTREWSRNIGSALGFWSERVRRGNLLLMVGIQPILSFSQYRGLPGVFADQLALALNDVTEKLAAALPTVRTTVLPAVSDMQRGSFERRTPSDYANWAAEIAVELVGHLDAAANGEERADVRVDRMTAGVPDAEHLAGLIGGQAATLDKIVAVAATAFQVPTAVVTLLGPDTQWHVSRHGIDLESVPIEQSFCAVAMRNVDGMVVPDASHDPRFAANPLVTGEGGIRYYAGVPIEDPDGRRIGALCVIDKRPHNVTTPADMGLLRRLASEVQRVVWSEVLRERASGVARYQASTALSAFASSEIRRPERSRGPRYTPSRLSAASLSLREVTTSTRSGAGMTAVA